VGLGSTVTAFGLIAGPLSGSNLILASQLLIAAPCLLIAGWVVGNRHASHPARPRSGFWEGADLPRNHGQPPDQIADAEGDRPMHSASPMLDGRYLGKVALVLSLLPALAALGFWILVSLLGHVGPQI
jgi:hypothetical protein